MAKNIYGLIGKNISYSFSKVHFTQKFEALNLLDYTYEILDFDEIAEFPKFLIDNPKLKGLNVTIPYKQAIIPYLDKLSKIASEIGAVNTIRFTRKGELKGYNTDYFGFKKMLKPLLQKHHKKALLLGMGGASKAVAYALNQLGIEYQYVSRTPKQDILSYGQVNEETFKKFQIIINCTPLGTYPSINECPDIPYHFFTPNHIAIDLIYNPAESLFLNRAKKNGSIIKNGQDMLTFQAELAWKIWEK